MASFWSEDEAGRLRGPGLTQRMLEEPRAVRRGIKNKTVFLTDTIHDVFGMPSRDRKFYDMIYLLIRYEIRQEFR